MKHYSLNTGEVVNFARLPLAQRYVNLSTGGVKHYASCTEAEMVAAGFLQFVEDALPPCCIPGAPVDVREGDTMHRTYPNQIQDEDAEFNRSMEAIEGEFEEKLAVVRAAILVAMANDGEALESNLTRLRADYQRIQAARNAAIDALFG